MSKFWGIKCSGNKTVNQELVYEGTPIALRVSQASFDESATGPSTLYASVGADKKAPKFAICTLNKDNAHTNLEAAFFPVDVIVRFSVVGKSSIHLTGQIEAAVEEYSEGEESDSEGGESDSVPLDGILGSSDDEEVDIASAKNIAKAKAKVAKMIEAAAVEEAESVSEEESHGSEETESEEEATPEPVKKVTKKRKREVEAKKEEPKPESKKKKAEPKPEPKKKKAEPVKKEKKVKMKSIGAVKYVDKTVGKGTQPKRGKRCVMHYEGRLQNGKVFDKSYNRGPFTFRLGVGEVIKGWDLGVSTMRVGGERTLFIPSSLAYGKRGAPPDIPKNADLIFEVKLLNVK